MKVLIKELNAEMELKNKGMEISVCDKDGKQVGDLVVNKSGLVWCKGKIHTANGKKISWKHFIDYMESL